MALLAGKVIFVARRENFAKANSRPNISARNFTRTPGLKVGYFDSLKFPPDCHRLRLEITIKKTK